MTHSETHSLARAVRDESGMALLIAVIVLLLMSALGLAALQHAGDEAAGSGSSRRKDTTLYAAESGLTMLQVKLLNSYWASATMSPVTLDEPSLVEDANGYGIEVRSGAPMNGTIPNAPGEQVGATTGGTSENANGYMLNIGNQGAQSFKPVRADVTALDRPTNGMVHLQSQFRVHEGSGGGSY